MDEYELGNFLYQYYEVFLPHPKWSVRELVIKTFKQFEEQVDKKLRTKEDLTTDEVPFVRVMNAALKTGIYALKDQPSEVELLRWFKELSNKCDTLLNKSVEKYGVVRQAPYEQIWYDQYGGWSYYPYLTRDYNFGYKKLIDDKTWDRIWVDIKHGSQVKSPSIFYDPINGDVDTKTYHAVKKLMEELSQKPKRQELSTNPIDAKLNKVAEQLLSESRKSKNLFVESE